MSSALSRIVAYGHLRRLVNRPNVRAIRSISSTARLYAAPLPPTLKPEVDPPTVEETETDPHEPLRTQEKPRLLRPVLFTLGVGIFSFAGASYLARRESPKRAQTTTTTGASVGDQRHDQIMRELQHANAMYAWLQEVGCPGPVLRSYAWLGNRWLNASDGERVALGLVTLNTIIFLAWQIPLPTVRFFMVKHFMHHPLSGRSYTLLTSAFSHMNLLHFSINMVALHSFVRESSFYIGSAESRDANFRGVAPPAWFTPREPNYTADVLAFFVTAGVFAAFGSHASQAFRLMRAKRQARDVDTLSRARNAIRPGLGASGAIYGTLLLTALAMPDVEVQLFFLPFLALPIRWGAAGLVAMDTAGVVRGWRLFDHHSHLSGAAFGAAYFFGGPYLWARTGESVSTDKVLVPPQA